MIQNYDLAKIWASIASQYMFFAIVSGRCKSALLSLPRDTIYDANIFFANYLAHIMENFTERFRA
jgi:hypothetical protein